METCVPSDLNLERRTDRTVQTGQSFPATRHGTSWGVLELPKPERVVINFKFDLKLLLALFKRSVQDHAS